MDPQNVVNVILTADSALGGYLYETTSILSNDSAKPITNGSMLIKDDQGNQVAYQLFGKDGAYFSSNIVQPLNCYHVEFNSGYGKSQGITCVPNQPNVIIEDSTIIDQPNDTTFEINITISDTSPNMKNYYRISCMAFEIVSIKVNSNGKVDTSYGWVTKIMNTRSFNYLINEYNYTNTGYLLRDDKFNGSNALLNFTFSISGTRKFRFKVDAIDENLFEYYRTLTAQQFVQNDPNAHYINVFSNISNGYGIVGAKNSWEFVFIND